MKKLFIEEQYLRSCPKEMATHLKEGKPETLHDLAERAEIYLRPTPVISSSGSIRNFLRSEDPFNPRDVIIVDPQVTLGTSVPSLSRQCLQEHHSLRFHGLVRSRNHQVMLPSNQHHLNGNHSGATLATRLGTFLETADQNPQLQWNFRDTTSLHHSWIISSSWITRIPKTTRTSRSQMR